MQSRLSSFIESMANVFIGYVLSLAVQIVVYLMFGATFTFMQNIKIGLVFMVVAIVRSYFLRRYFNARIHAAALRLAGTNTPFNGAYAHRAARAPYRLSVQAPPRITRTLQPVRAVYSALVQVRRKTQNSDTPRD